MVCLAGKLCGKFGGELNLAAWQSTFATAKIRQHFIHMAIPYQTAKFKSANILAMAIWGSTTKFNPHKYFHLYGMSLPVRETRYTVRASYIHNNHKIEMTCTKSASTALQLTV